MVDTLRNRFFTRPVLCRWQVDDEGLLDEWFYGIAYEDKLICAECGGVTEFNEVTIFEESQNSVWDMVEKEFEVA